MKKLFKTTIICVGALAITSCNDWLDTKSDSQLEESALYSSVESIKLATYGVYADLCDEPYTQLMTIHQGAGTDIELIDGVGQTAVGDNERGGMNYNATTSWAKLGTLWEKQYKTIEDCNRIADGIAASSLATDPEAMKYSAEVRVIRAMVYLDMIRVFGDIPFQWNGAKSDLSNINVGKTDRDIILDALIADLEKVVAEDKLPWCGESSTSEHVTMGYARGLLANIYMTRAGFALREDNNENAEAGGYSSGKKVAAGYVKTDPYTGTDTYSDDTYMTLRPSDAERAALYTKAHEHLKAVMDKGIHKMNPSFADEWEKLNKLELDQTYYENMFEIPMGFGISGEQGYTVGVRMNGTTTDFGFSNSSGKVKTTAVHLYTYAPCDTRRDISCIAFELKNFDRTDLTTSNMEEVIDGVTVPVETETGSAVTAESLVKNKPWGLYLGKWDVRKMSDRWKAQNLTASLKFGYGINPVRMRYPQILLWFAECENELNGPTTAAKDALKAVHARAYNDAPTKSYNGESTANEELYDFNADVDNASTKAALQKLISFENALEFCGEGFRKWDLIRWNTLHDAIVQFKKNYVAMQDADAGTKVFQDKVYFKYKDYEIVKDENGNVIKVKAPEKRIDWASVTWYGTDGTNKLPLGSDPSKDKDWINSNGYRYAKAASDGYDYPGFGKDHKDLNAQSYVMNSFGQDYANFDTEFSTICGGLVGTWDGTDCDDSMLKVKNRYIMPIYNNVLSSSNGRLYNSYGY